MGGVARKMVAPGKKTGESTNSLGSAGRWRTWSRGSVEGKKGKPETARTTRLIRAKANQKLKKLLASWYQGQGFKGREKA